MAERYHILASSTYKQVRERTYELAVLPWAATEAHNYHLPYGTDIIEIHRDAINPGNRVILVDDLLATGGTAHASAKLVEKLGGTVEEICFIVDLPDVGGHKKLVEAGYRVFCLTEFEGE